MAVLVGGFVILGIVAGFTWSVDRELTAGLLQQRIEAMQREDWVPLDDLPPHVPNAFIAVVDPGFEGAPTPRRPRDEAETIPRHLVRQIHLLGHGMGSQARERVMAPVLEQRTNRRQLLEFYLNRVYLGLSQEVPVYGIHHAALEYLGKDAREMTVGEAATIASLLLPPMIERPEERPGAVGARRNEVLRALLQAGYITPQDFQQAVGERLAFQPGLRFLPMTRRIPLAADTAVIRLPPEYRPQPEEEDPQRDL